MPEARRRRRQKRIRIGLAGLAAVSLTAASAGGAMGWVMGGTTTTIAEYKARPKASVPDAGKTVRSGDAEVVVETIGSPSEAVATPSTPAFFPANNTVQWSTTVAPGQPLSAISVRNGDQTVNLIAHLTAKGLGGGMVPVASMTVSPGKEAVIRPPAGDYAMQVVASPVDMPYGRIAALPRSAPATFDLAPRDQTATPSVRFDVSKGVIRRLPDPNASQTASRRHRADADDEYAYAAESSSDAESDDR